MSKRLDLALWKRVERQLRAARAKRDTLLDDDKVTKLDERIWKLEGKYAHFVLKYRGTDLQPPDSDTKTKGNSKAKGSV